MEDPDFWCGDCEIKIHGKDRNKVRSALHDKKGRGKRLQIVGGKSHPAVEFGSDPGRGVDSRVP